MIGTLQQEAAKLADVMSTAGASLTHLACSEADAIARVLVAAGFKGAAVDLIIDHAGPDEDGEDGDLDQYDLHHHMYGPACDYREHDMPPELLEMARDYLRAL
jgi:hypothetical protein